MFEKWIFSPRKDTRGTTDKPSRRERTRLKIEAKRSFSNDRDIAIIRGNDRPGSGAKTLVAGERWLTLIFDKNTPVSTKRGNETDRSPSISLIRSFLRG